VMVTRPSAARLPFIARAVELYAQQTYPHRELVVVLDSADETDDAFLETRIIRAGRRNVRIVRASGNPTLGRLRNLGIDEARGEFVCVWDDDDIHHPTRIECQIHILRAHGAIATFLTDVLHLFVEERELYWTTYKRVAQRCVPGTGIFLRSVIARYPETGPESQRGEDTVFCLALAAEGYVHLIDDMPHLYVYVAHGSNTSGKAFHRMLASSLAVSRGRLTRSQKLVCSALDGAELDLAEVKVVGNNGVAFVWRPAIR
jgi:glycosyltransferase involved in cell wall biosynthesis